MPYENRLRAGSSRASVALVLALGVIACAPDRAASPVVPTIHIAEGDRQHGAPREPLNDLIVVVVTQWDGSPSPNVEVEWSALDGGTCEPGVSVTDVNGRAASRWTLGERLGTQRARARAADGSVVEFFASTASKSELPLNEPRTLRLTTYEGSGQTVHPDVAQVPLLFGADRSIAITPYPYGDANKENPSFFVGADEVSWLVPRGATNPVLSTSHGYLSDPDLVYDPLTRELLLYYREVSDRNVILRVQTRDGVRWTTPVIVTQGPNHTILSPTVVRIGPTDWRMWAVNGNTGCTGSTTVVEERRSSDGVVWSAARVVQLDQPGFWPWHIEVQWIPSRAEYWALYNVKTAGSCTTPALYLATSRDGLSWTTYPSPVLDRGVIPELEDVVYRSTFEYDAVTDRITFWFSGARYEGGRYVWRSIVQPRTRADVFAAIARPYTSMAYARDGKRQPPPLLDAP
jgi:hypothetical protein